MPVPEAFTVARGGFTTLAGAVDHHVRALLAALGREVNALGDRMTTAEADIAAAGTEISPDVLTLADDQAAYMTFTIDAARAVAVFGANLAAGGNGVVAFRVGGSAFTSLVASSGATVTVGTGTLAGTTGVDGELTIRADTATNRLYIENRTGASRIYGLSFLGMIGAPSDGTWTVV